ncbi:1-acyl-sn-glycerol-3-phosphate acyltransferase [Thermanaerovibrio velox DSM 12556]|uniref:1-acyl-sn-glycerol-3-phosphate acyltransferase n=1 Tax=Thermanaerovibrio velox DSM 12556 TaxID=926567 RepID=H0UNZ0_9BACT|nr:lysophospholipid acyltransferase family protein [Thermanaerovibrio velox]EHM10493.1 1-acyl-sn-glycerol-3-phosphate acyltransferase [Thermanaerovibrio velox DSM 12556]
MKNLFYALTRCALWIYFKLYHRLTVEGIENIPSVNVIVAPNHCSYLDPPAVGTAFPRRLTSIAWEGLFKSRFFSMIITALGAVKVSHQDAKKAAAVLKLSIELLRSGHDLMIFPEGQRSPTGELMPLEGGVALMALKANRPIVPVVIKGSFEALPTHLRFPRPKKITIRFLPPIWPPSDDSKDPKTIREEILRKLEEALRAGA